jgi:uncharacterized protein RhaS with RHS repeats
LSVDPLGGDYPFLTAYGYGLDNPLKYIDPNGEEVRIYSRWSGPGHRHLFIVVKNGKSDVFTSRSLMPAGGPMEGFFTALPFVHGNETPVIRRDLDSDLGAVKRQEAGEKDVDAHMEMVVSPPKGKTEDAFDKEVLRAADNYDTKHRPYDADEGPNSNTYVNDVIESHGVKLPQFDKATQQKWSDEQKRKTVGNRKDEEEVNR